MKKLIALLLVLTMAVGLVACAKSGNNNDNTTVPTETTEPTASNVGATDSALTILETIWNGVPEDNKFFVMGGDMNNMVDNAPGAYSLESEDLSFQLLVPAEQIANLDQAASLFHGMNLNNFTCGVYHIVEGGDGTVACAEGFGNML